VVTGKVCGVLVDGPLGHSWAPTLSRESMVNVGTVPVLPSDRPSGSAAGRLVVS